MKPQKILLLLLVAAAQAQAASVLTTNSDGTGGGSWAASASWSSGVPVNNSLTNSQVNILAGDTINAGSDASYTGPLVGLNVYGTLNVNTGASLTAGVINNASTTSGGIINVAGGSLTANGVGTTSTGTLSINVTAGTFSTSAMAFNSYPSLTFSQSGGTTFITHTATIGPKITLTGGSFIFNSGDTGNVAFNNNLTWNGGTIVSNTNAMGNTSLFTAMATNAANVLAISTGLTTAQTLSLTSTATTANQGTLSFAVYSTTSNDKIAITGTTLTLGSGVHVAVNGLSLAGVYTDYLNTAFTLFSAPTYTTLNATVDSEVWTIGGVQYTAAFTNDLNVNGTVIVSSLTAVAVPEPSLSLLLLFGAGGLLLARRLANRRLCVRV